MQTLDIQGNPLPVLGLGTWQLTGANCAGAVETAIKLGYRHIDTAQIYENEAEVGAGWQAAGVARAELFITTKIWLTNYRASAVRSSFAQSLKKLRTDYVDLLLIHWPSNDVPLAETLAAMADLQKAGQVRAVGVSNFTVALLQQAVQLGHNIACNQVEYHALLAQRPVLDFARQHNMVVTAYSPLARGQLNNRQPLQEIARRYNKSVSQLALRWLIQQPGVAAIPKASSAEHLRENMAIFDFVLAPADMQAISALNEDKRLINPQWSPAWDQAA